MPAMPNGEQPPQVPISPLPTLWQVGQVSMSDGKTMVLIQIQTPQGVSAFFLDPKSAMEFGAAIAQNGRGASSGLLLPPSALN